MSWSDDQTLICIVQDGTIYRYNTHDELVEPNVSMGKECFEQNVVECVFWGNGVVCLTEGGQLFCISDFKTMKPCKLVDVPGLTEDDMIQPVCLAVREPQYTLCLGMLRCWLQLGMIFKIGSTSPAALLYDALDQLIKTLEVDHQINTGCFRR